MADLTFYFEQYALLSMEKQEKFSQLAGGHTMELDLDAGIVRFSADLRFPFQVLGTESDNTLTWLWGWAEEQTELPEELIRSSLQMKDWGEQNGVADCMMPSVDLSKASGHVFSVIASEICAASCYYHEIFEGGGLFLLLFGNEIDRQPGFTVAALSRQLSFLTDVRDFNHRNAFRSYCTGKNLSFTEHAGFVVSRLESGEDIRINFDSMGKLISINGKELAA